MSYIPKVLYTYIDILRAFSIIVTVLLLYAVDM